MMHHSPADDEVATTLIGKSSSNQGASLAAWLRFVSVLFWESENDVLRLTIPL